MIFCPVEGDSNSNAWIINESQLVRVVGTHTTAVAIHNPGCSLAY